MATPYDYLMTLNPNGTGSTGQQSPIQNFMDQQWEKTGGGIDPGMRRIIENVQRTAANAPPAPAPAEPAPHVWAKPVNDTTPAAPLEQTPVAQDPNARPMYVSNAPEMQQLSQAQQMRQMIPSGNTAINPQTGAVQPSGAVDNMDLQALVNQAIQRLIAGGYNG